VVTVAVLSEKFKIGGSLARKFLAEQTKAGKIKAVAPSSKMGVYTRAD
jgi:ribosomal protein S25